MDEEPVRIIRETTRNLLKLNRQAHKDELADVRRCIDAVRITSDSVADIANRLKNKSTVSLSELHTLKNSLIDDQKNIKVVLSTQSSLRGLVREISGTDVKRQCAAAGCCCNLALGDSKACSAVAKAAGPYLVAALDNFSKELAVTCAWAIGNMAGSGSKACETLAAQGALAKLIGLLAAGREEVCDAAVYALTHFAYQMKDDFSPDYISQIIAAYSKLEVTSATSQLLFILSCHDQFSTELPEQLLLRILDSLNVSTENHVNTCSGSDLCCKLVYLIRSLANISVVKSNSDIILCYFVEKEIDVYFKKILIAENCLVKESLLWLLGNLYNCSGASGIFNDFAC